MTWYNYTPLAPLIEHYRDDGTRDLLLVECEVNGDRYRVAAIGERHVVEMIRVETVGSDGNLTQEQGRSVAQLIDHMIVVLRHTTPFQIEKLWLGSQTISLGSHGDPAGKPNLSVRISELTSHIQLDCKNIAAVFRQTIDERQLFKLLGDAAQPSLPLQYQFLSLYKVLEHEFREGKKWPRLQQLVVPWSEEFRLLGIGRQSLENFLHGIRDKCAHIKVGKGEMGITGLSTADADLVNQVMPILKKIVFAHLMQKYPTLRFEAPAATG